MPHRTAKRFWRPLPRSRADPHSSRRRTCGFAGFSGRLHAGPERLSRHWFDLACLAQHGIGRSALTNRNLLEEVVRHKKIFFNASYANYDQCLRGTFRLIPDDDQLVGLQSDYDAMRSFGIVTSAAPKFDALIGQLRILEAKINNLA